ncbi:MAG: CCA tRNA nucleotidyltransferase [Candidatus Micrarchaeota archaeon]|nr:CCA tRNA nucleotidyltransferase [Candidatus Micrarchaeota archaeon]
MESLKEQLRPDNTEALKIFEEVREKLGEDLKMYGSVAKGTNLKGDYDLDVFFETEMGKKEAFEYILEKAKKVFDKVVVRYAEHPYVRIFYKGIWIDIVPLSKKEKSAVDRTPYHYRYVVSHLTEEQKDEVRLLKRFLKALGLYGAEIRVGGFSGYATELLIIHYGTFENTIKHMANWKFYKTIIDIEGNRSRDFQEPLVIVDPVDGNRNVAAAVELDTMAKAILYARKYLESPSEEFFFEKEKDPEPEFGILFSHDVVEEQLFGQLKRMARAWRKYLEDHKIFLKWVSVYGNENYGYIGGIPVDAKVSFKDVRQGPRADMRFGKIKGELFLKDGYINIVRPYDYELESLTKEFFQKYPIAKQYKQEKMGWNLPEFEKERKIDAWRRSLLF